MFSCIINMVLYKVILIPFMVFYYIYSYPVNAYGVNSVVYNVVYKWYYYNRPSIIIESEYH